MLTVNLLTIKTSLVISGCKPTADGVAWDDEEVGAAPTIPTTKFWRSNFVKVLSSKEILLNEINKCISLCANCHREFHYLNSLNNLKLEDYLNGDY